MTKGFMAAQPNAASDASLLPRGIARIIDGFPVATQAESLKRVNDLANELGKVMERFDHIKPFIRIPASKYDPEVTKRRAISR